MTVHSYSFVVTIQVAATRQDSESYIYDAVRSYGGAFPPDDPFFGDNKVVTVKPYRRSK